MKALILDGTASADETAVAVHAALAAELDDRGFEVTHYLLREEPIADCLGCFGCWLRTPGECAIDDPARGVGRDLVSSDLTVLLTPVTFGGYSAELKKGLDRLICYYLPFFAKRDGETHHPPRYRRRTRLLGIGLVPRHDPESERIFSTLVQRNAVNLMAPARAAGVVMRGAGPEAVHDQVHALLHGAGVV